MSCEDCRCREGAAPWMVSPSLSEGVVPPLADAFTALTVRINAVEAKHYKLRLEVCYLWTILLVFALAALVSVFVGL